MVNKPKQQRPVVGASTDLWGDVLNQNMDLIDNFASAVVDELGTHSQELARLEQDKINIADLDTVVTDRVDNYIETDAKPQLDAYINDEKKPELDAYTVQKKSDINNYVETVSKVSINDFTEVQKTELNTHELLKESELDAHELLKESELDSHTLAKQTQLDTYEDSKEAELEVFTVTKKAEINTYKDSMNSEINLFTEANKIEITEHTDNKKVELDSHEKVKEGQLDTYTIEKESQIDVYTLNKKGEIDTKTEEEKLELDAYNEVKKGQLDTHEASKEAQLDIYADGREAEMVVKADTEIARINATGLDGKLDIITYNTDKVIVETNLNAKLDKTVYNSDKAIMEGNINSKLDATAFDSYSVIAGKGTAGGGKLSVNPVIDVVALDDSMVIENDGIKVNTVDDLVTGGIKRPLSANQGKQLQDTKADKTIQIVAGNGLTGGGDLTSNKTLNVASANDGITVNADNIQLNVQNVLTSTSTTQPLSANQGKQLQDTKADKTYVDSKPPVPIGGILMFDVHTINPATLFSGTTWVRIAENRNIRGAANGEGTGLIGGSDTVNISQSNLPNINLTATDHTHTRGSMEITGNLDLNGTVASGSSASGAFSMVGVGTGFQHGNAGDNTRFGANFYASHAWTGATSGASATTVPLGGSGTGLNVTNAYYKMHIWKRLT